MARNPMSTPSADPYSTYNTDKNKKKKQTSGYVTNTVTAPRPAQDASTPSATKNYEQPVPQPPKATSQTVKSSGTTQAAVGAKTAVDTIQSKPYIYDSVPIPQTNTGGYKQPQGYSSTKPTQKQAGGYTAAKARTSKTASILPYGNTVQKNNYGPNREAAQSVQLAEYTPKQENKTGYSFGTANPQYTSGTAYSPQNPYTTKDRVTEYNTAGMPKVKQSALQSAVFVGAPKQTVADFGWGVPKAKKDGAQTNYNGFAGFSSNVNLDSGVNREIANSAPKADESMRQIYIEYLKRGFSGGTGISNETAQNSFLDHRGQNPVEKFIEKNPYDVSNSRTVVTKDNIYEQPKDVIEKELNKTGTFVNREISTLKRQREDLLFDLQYGRIDSDDEQLQKVNYDIQYLEHIEKKIELGLKYSYQFEQEDLNRLSNMSIDDILNSKEEFSQNLPYLSPYAQAIRSANKGYKSYQNSVGVVDNIGVEYISRDDKFRIFDKNNPENEFKFRIDSEFNPKGYYEKIISADKSAVESADDIQFDLLKAIDGKAVSHSTADKLVKMAKENGKTANGIFDVMGYALDFADFWIVMDSDKEFNNGEVGIDTYKAGGELVGSIAGDIAGSTVGAKAGAAIGTVAFGPIGTVIGSVLGAAAGAYLLSSAMEEIGGYIGGNVYEYQPADPYQQYYERTK